MKKNFGKSLFILLTLAVTVACTETKEKVKSIRPVRTEKPLVMRSGESKITLPASINELRETKLSFHVGGPLIKLNDVIGDYVKRGEIIAKLDPRDFKVAVESTESRYNLAKAEYERYKNLMEKESVSKSVFDQMETAYKLAKNDFEAASNAFEDTEIKAPFSGYINHVFVNNFEEVPPGSPIISLLDISNFEVNGWISVEDVNLIDENTDFACIVKQGDKKVRISGKLKEIGNKTSISKQSLPITIVIDSTEDLKLKAGMTTYLEINLRKERSKLSFQIPITSIFTKDGKILVWVLDEQSSKVSSRAVTTGKILDDGSIEILDGLSGEETVVTAGASYLFEGQKVKKIDKLSKSNVGNKL